MSIENKTLSAFNEYWSGSGRIGLMAGTSDDGFNTLGKIRRHIHAAEEYEKLVPAEIFSDVMEIVEKNFLASDEMLALDIHDGHDRFK